MDYLGALRMFVRAVEVGSFSKAAIATNTKTSTVSRAIASLEEDLGVSLFHRTTRRAHLTEPGATFYEHARGVLRGLEEARDAASAMEGRPQGLIRLHVPSAFARLWGRVERFAPPCSPRPPPPACTSCHSCQTSWPPIPIFVSMPH